MMKLLRNRKGRCLRFNPWNQDAEAGDYMVAFNGLVFRLEESSSWYKRAAGELTVREVNPPPGYSKAILKAGQIFWVGDTEAPQ